MRRGDKKIRLYSSRDKKDVRDILGKAVRTGRVVIKSRVQSGRRTPAYLGHPVLRRTVSLWPRKV
jgi:hypothetical protein